MNNNAALKKYTPSDFNADDRLYRGFKEEDLLPKTNDINVNSISFPDVSCNWSQFSFPKDIRKRENGSPTDGCYSFTVEVSRFESMATPCHDPIKDNYSHTEIRQLRSDENIYFEPPKGRQKMESHNWSKSKKLMYRKNIADHLVIELEIGS